MACSISCLVPPNLISSGRCRERKEAPQRPNRPAGLEIDSEKVETNRYSIKEKYRKTSSIINR